MEKNKNKTKKQNQKINYSEVKEYGKKIEQAQSWIEKNKIQEELVNRLKKDYGISIYSINAKKEYNLKDYTHAEKFKIIMFEMFGTVIYDRHKNKRGDLIAGQKEWALLFGEIKEQRVMGGIKAKKGTTEINYTKRHRLESWDNSIDYKAKFKRGEVNESQGLGVNPNILNKEVFNQIVKNGITVIENNSEWTQLSQLIVKNSNLTPLIDFDYC